MDFTMKLSFSTLGCPDWMLNEVLAAANDFGYDGVEIRGLGADLFLPKAPVFGAKRLATSLKEIANSGLELSCISSDASCLLSSKSGDVQSNIREYVDLAVLLGAKNIRILADEWGYESEAVDRELVYDNLKKASPYAEEKGVLLLVETTGVYADTAALRDLIERVDSPAVKALWDIHHPYVYKNESPARTIENIGKYIRHVHIKDSVREKGGIVYKMLGHGSLPVADMIDSLKSIGYEGYLSLEWMKRWNDDLEEPGVVFEHFARKIKTYL
jgi:fatty-acyl-CoA synthase